MGVKIIQSTDGPLMDTSVDLNKRETWQENYALAKKYGAWMQDSHSFLVPREGKVVRIDDAGMNGEWVTTGKQLIKVINNRSGDNIRVFGVDFQGNLLWSAKMAPLKPWTTAEELQFNLGKFEITDTALLLHGYYRYGWEQANRRLWTISLPLSELEALAGAH